MAKIAERISDKRLLKLIRSFLQAGVMEDGLVSSVDEGTPQGGPLSPLLSNIVLDEFDRELECRKLRFARYADDSNIYVRSQRAGERVMKSLVRFIATRLKLKVNEQKSAVAEPWERKFLGFSFTGGPTPRRRIAPKALLRFKERVREPSVLQRLEQWTRRRLRSAIWKQWKRGRTRFAELRTRGGGQRPRCQNSG
jgi:RNA-directed DNA polymerase